jgi:hypothetical protein
MTIYLVPFTPQLAPLSVTLLGILTARAILLVTPDTASMTPVALIP